jgi:ankyrin repeat protein
MTVSIVNLPYEILDQILRLWMKDEIRLYYGIRNISLVRAVCKTFNIIVLDNLFGPSGLDTQYPSIYSLFSREMSAIVIREKLHNPSMRDTAPCKTLRRVIADIEELESEISPDSRYSGDKLELVSQIAAESNSGRGLEYLFGPIANEDIYDHAELESETNLFVIAAAMGNIRLLESLSPRISYLNGESSLFGVPLFTASSQGRLEVVQWILEKDPSVLKFEYCYSAIRIAAHKGHLEVLSFFLKHKQIIHDEIRALIYALLEAVKMGHLGCVKAFYDYKPLLFELTPSPAVGLPQLLVEAVKHRHDDIALYLIEKGAPPEYDMAASALTAAAAAGNERMMRKLLDIGAQVDWVEPNRDTPLNQAAMSGNIECVRLLLEAGADPIRGPDSAIQDSPTPLGCACIGGHIEIVKLLLTSGADPNAGAGVQTKQKKAGSCLAAAVIDGHEEIVKILLDHNADPDAFDHSYKTSWMSPIAVAICQGHFEIVKLLVESGCNVHSSGRVPAPPVRIAIQEGHQDIAEYLFEHGAMRISPVIRRVGYWQYRVYFLVRALREN